MTPAPPAPDPTAPHVTVYFAYNSDLPNQAGTWSAAFFLPHHDDEDGHVFSGLLSPQTTSEDGALHEILRLLHLLDIHHAQLYSDRSSLVTRRAADLPEGLSLSLCPLNHIRQRVAQRETYRLARPFTELHTQGRHQRALRDTPTLHALLTCRFRCERQTLFLDLCAHGLHDTLQLGRLSAHGQLLLNPLILKPLLHQHLLRLYGPALLPDVVRLGDLLLTELEHRLPELHQHGRTLWATPAGVERLFKRAGVVLEPAHLYYTRVSTDQIRITYRGRHTTRNLKRPPQEWGQIVRDLMQSVGASETDLLQHETYTRQVLDFVRQLPFLPLASAR